MICQTCYDRRRLMLALALSVLVVLWGVTHALAQQTASETIVNVNDLMAPWLPLIGSAVAALLIALLGYLSALFKQWTGIEIEKAHMQTLQASLENAAGQVVMRLSDQLKDARFDARHPAIKQAIEYVNASAADSVKAFDLTPEQLAEKIIAKIGVITAPDPTASPKDVTPPSPDTGRGA